MKRLAIIAVAWLPLLAGIDSIPRAAALVAPGIGPHPYFVPDHAWLLYLIVPLVAASAGVAVMTPGLLLTWSSRREGLGVWIMRASGVSLVVVSIGASLSGVLLGAPVTGQMFVAVLALLSIAAAVLTRRAWQSDVPLSRSSMPVALAVVVPVALVAALAPKLLWESFNGDGAHAFETARLAVRQFVPFWDPAAGALSTFPGMSTVLFAYPASWFMRLFGETEAAVRLPYLLVLVATQGAIVAVAERGRDALGRGSHALIWLALVVYTVVQAFSATYDPYSADLAMPGLPATLQIFTFLGFVHSYLARRSGWTAAFLLLTLTSSPSGLVLVIFWLAAMVVSGGREERPAALAATLMLFAAMVAMALAPVILGALSLPRPGKEHGLGGLVTRFAFLQFTDWRRVLWVVVPSGIFPFAAYVVWPRLDAAGRALLLVTAAQFALFYFQAYVMIHQFAPAMLLPLAAVWRRQDAPWRAWHGLAAAAASGLALWVSLPPARGPVTAARVIGQTIDDRGSGRADLHPASYNRSFLLNHLFPEDYKPAVPAESYGGSALAWAIYARRNPTPAADINYVLTDLGAPAPAEARLLATNAAGSLYVKDEAVLQRHRALRPPTPAGSRLYWTPRGLLFRGAPVEDGPWILDVPALLARMGVDVDGIARRLRK
ncbi:MAG: hypothetical protein ACKVZ0_07180 [Gemmatimonadales bacterium]